MLLPRVYALVEAGQTSAAKTYKYSRDVWKDRDVQVLVAQRRVTRDSTERRLLCKRIQQTKQNQGIEADMSNAPVGDNAE